MFGTVARKSNETSPTIRIAMDWRAHYNTASIYGYFLFFNKII